MNHISFNGKMVLEAQAILQASNRGYRYGDGLFETMKIVNGKILLQPYHFERLFAGLSLLKFEIPKLFTIQKMEEEIRLLCHKNDCEKLGRIRLSVFRGNGGLYDEDKRLQYLVECWPLPPSFNQLNENGLVIDIYPDAVKNNDKFSNLKSASFLPYSMAAIFAKENKLNDCLVLNNGGSIADSTIANIFIIKNESICTPALDKGCVNGVMRRHLLTRMNEAGNKILEKTITADDLMDADEVFLTNAINGLRWVKQFRQKAYTNTKTLEIYNRFVKTIWE